VNNIVLPGTSMPHVLWSLQAWQEAVWEGHPDAQGKRAEAFQGVQARQHWIASPRTNTTSSCAITVNFLDYIGEPVQLKRTEARLPGHRIPDLLHAAGLGAEERVLEGREVARKRGHSPFSCKPPEKGDVPFFSPEGSRA